MQDKNTLLGIGENIEGLLCYLLGFITGILFLIIEQKNKFVRFHAMQSTVVFGAIFIVQVVLSFIPFIGWIIGIIVWIVSVVVWVLLMIKAVQGERYKLPYAGDFAEKQVGV